MITDSGKWKPADVYEFGETTAVLTGGEGDDMAVTEGLSGEKNNKVMMIEGRVLKLEDRIHDLLDVLENEPGFPADRRPEEDRPRPDL
jgi:hypothetical protein